MNNYDVVIIGGGCAGIFLASELVDRGRSCALLDKEPVASYASTRNQGWLQSGAFYAASGDVNAARGCKTGYEYITASYPEAIHQSVPSYYLFKAKDELETALVSCGELGIPLRELGTGDLQSLVSENSLLEGAPFSYVAETSDKPFDTNLLLRRVVGQAVRQGVDYYKVAEARSINPEPSGDGWHIAAERHRMQGKFLVLACGPFIPEMLHRFALDDAHDIKVTKTPVFVVQAKISNCALIAPRTTRAPNIIPFGERRGIEGVSICLSRADFDARDADDYEVDYLPSGASVRDEFGKRIQQFCPGIEQLVAAGEITGHIYACQKIKPRSLEESRGAYIRFYDVEGCPLSVFYPGKFTSSPVSASQHAGQIERTIPSYSPVTRGGSKRVPDVAEQRYYDPSQYKLKMRNGVLDLDPVF
ncbi:FAD-dependent oxidoreductase [Streptomyces sp. SAI-149]|uniref:NAD(P)/FAD-dependent oxidoreductase n=1 Tax=Streptomyces sp. SAI-149 TaxID=2940542 RepID=UPI002475E1E2|nr:FAD-dependent oxidoreductase [Streptomyces sp. SAI-149]MDH6502414.1 glycerol-3-phosphate dehydrogenase [Streptomyces sp. SAI-149]